MAAHTERDPGKGIVLIFQRPRDCRVPVLHASIRVLVADEPSAGVLAEVKALIGAATDMMVVGEAHDGRTALILATELKPDVIILDISMLGLRTAEVVEDLRAAWPASKIILHINHDNEGSLRQVVELGVTGCLLKCSTPNKLIAAIRVVVAGGFFFDPSVVKRSDGDASSPRLKSITRVG
jgi:DNA-binding NarL/FixJ family response regulator